MNTIASASTIIGNVSAQADSCLLFLSTGKDSLVTLDLVYPRFKRIVCVYMYFVKGLEHIERWLKWVRSRYPRVELVQVPHWNLTYIYREGVFCPPQPDVRLMKLRDVVKSCRLRYGIYYTFLGMKKSDGMNRNIMLKTYEKQNYENQGMVYPLAEWSQHMVLSYMRQRNLPQPVRYSTNNSSGVGFNTECLLWMEKNFPQDLRTFFKAFPMSEKLLFDYHNKEKEEKE